jgi:hypothetical protein
MKFDLKDFFVDRLLSLKLIEVNGFGIEGGEFGISIVSLW